MIPKECLDMTVKEYRKWQKENIGCDKCEHWDRLSKGDNCRVQEGHWLKGESCSSWESNDHR